MSTHDDLVLAGQMTPCGRPAENGLPIHERTPCQDCSCAMVCGHSPIAYTNYRGQQMCAECAVLPGSQAAILADLRAASFEWHLIHRCGVHIGAHTMPSLLQLVAEHYMTCPGTVTIAAPGRPRPDEPIRSAPV